MAKKSPIVFRDSHEELKERNFNRLKARGKATGLPMIDPFAIDGKDSVTLLIHIGIIG